MGDNNGLTRTNLFYVIIVTWLYSWIDGSERFLIFLFTLYTKQWRTYLIGDQYIFFNEYINYWMITHMFMDGGMTIWICVHTHSHTHKWFGEFKKGEGRKLTCFKHQLCASLCLSVSHTSFHLTLTITHNQSSWRISNQSHTVNKEVEINFELPGSIWLSVLQHAASLDSLFFPWLQVMIS